MTDGEKSHKMRRAIQRTIDALPDTANKPRHDLREMLNAPTLVLAMLHDEIAKEEGE